MPLKLNVGLSKKVGLPSYGSLGASCHVELELDQSLLFNDLEQFHDKVRQAFIACNQAVNDELNRQQPPADGKAAGPNMAHTSKGNGHAPATNHRQRRDNVRPATVSQVRAIEAIAQRQTLNLAEILWNDFGYSHAGELSISEASNLIDELKGSASGQCEDQANHHANGDSR